MMGGRGKEKRMRVCTLTVHSRDLAVVKLEKEISIGHTMKEGEGWNDGMERFFVHMHSPCPRNDVLVDA